NLNEKIATVDSGIKALGERYNELDDRLENIYLESSDIWFNHNQRITALENIINGGSGNGGI
ncbi:hypothetical protein F6353_002749, partial [Enterococcus faecium]|nr:hypothetical protein [Enterococcus faecium]